MFKYKIEIVADSIGELMTKTRITFGDISGDADFIRRIESKGMESVFFTKYANISIVDTEKDEEL